MCGFGAPAAAPAKQADTCTFKDDEGAKALAENPLSSARSKRIGLRHHVITGKVSENKNEICQFCSPTRGHPYEGFSGCTFQRACRVFGEFDGVDVSDASSLDLIKMTANTFSKPCRRNICLAAAPRYYVDRGSVGHIVGIYIASAFGRH